MENAAEFYYEKLSNSKNPAIVLASFFKELTGIEYGRREIIMYNRLIKTFGRFLVFFAILDVANIKDLKEGNMYGLFYSVCKRKFAERNKVDPSLSSETLTTGRLESLAKKVKKQKVSIPDSSEL